MILDRGRLLAGPDAWTKGVFQAELPGDFALPGFVAEWLAAHSTAADRG